MAAPSPAASSDGKPVAIVCVGMAGSGKTTFMQRINSYLHQQKTPPYVMNLDPAVHSTPYESNIDIRDSVNYKEVMKQYNLGPNGGILTSLNLFATKIDQVLTILEKRCLPQAQDGISTATQAPASQPPKHILIDTPGQIEVFVWSASGSILLSTLASSFPTVLAYIIDTPRTTSSTSTFMSNMLYAISILYKTRLPMILVFNKTDVKSPDEAIEWMRDFESFQAALKREEESNLEGSGGGGTGYMSSLLNSMSLVLEEFYNSLSVVSLSSMTGEGTAGFFAAVEEKRAEFDAEYAPELVRMRARRERDKEGKREKEVERLMRDMGVGSQGKKEKKVVVKGPAREEPETISDAEEASDDQERMDEDDEDDEDEEEEEEDDDAGGAVEAGLQERYGRALKDTGASNEDMSFAKYVQMAGLNR